MFITESKCQVREYAMQVVPEIIQTPDCLVWRLGRKCVWPVQFWTWCSSSLCYFPFAWLANTACWFWPPHWLYAVGTVLLRSGHTRSRQVPPTAPPLTLGLSTAMDRCKLLFRLNVKLIFVFLCKQCFFVVCGKYPKKNRRRKFVTTL